MCFGHAIIAVLLMFNSALALSNDTPTWTAETRLTSDNPKITGLKIPPNWQQSVKFESVLVRGALPAKFDWRDKGLSDVRDQGSCGSCWAFSIAATMEDLMKLTGISTPLSQQHVLSCNPQGYGCNGGWFDASDVFVNPGTVTANQWAYTAKQESCRTNLKYGEKLQSMTFLPGAENGKAVPAVDQIKAAIYQYGPISVAVAASNAFSSYRSGIFNTCGDTNINHAVNLVGWNDDGGYWIMRNSWRSSWGENGYMRIKYGCNEIGYSANYFKYRLSPTPGPGPGPDPTPTPEPEPTCTPQAKADAGADQTINKNEFVLLGTPALKGHKYAWSIKEFPNHTWKVAQVKARGFRRGVMTFLLTATTRCGSATDSVILTVH